ncbi:MAG: CPBP family intramembrane metalloprotease, partial [Pyrinomonadaceae bacterium]|nr:CPBP family intramembrane metalloprotease [Pyrinomonadaceae bacterium]
VKNFLTGSIFGALSLLFAAMLAMFGGLSFTVNQVGLSLLIQSLLLSFALFVVAAAAEEAMFRGYALQTLTRARFVVVAIILTAMPFGLVHTQNPDFTNISLINTVLAGVWFGIAYLKTRDLWFPLGIHWAWNFTMGSILGLPVSGLKLVENPVLSFDDKSPIWLGGGSYGLEGGIVTTIAILVSMLVIWRVPFLKPTAEMLSLTNQENISQQAKIDNYLKDNAFRE